MCGHRPSDNAGDFTADLALTDIDGPRTLNMAGILGTLGESTWQIAGPMGNLVLRRTASQLVTIMLGLALVTGRQDQHVVRLQDLLDHLGEERGRRVT